MAMAKNLVIVESPTKAKTIGRFLGSNYAVKASLGHVRDLPERNLGINIGRGFQPFYIVPEEKRAVIKELKELLKDADTLYLATDPDREGEAIAWHLLEAIDPQGKTVHRVEFHEITKAAIDEAFKHPRVIHADLVNAQQARRMLDRLVGYELSPLLWKKLRKGLSAGRVQSAALKMVVDREKEIEAFKPVEYWRISVQLAKHITNGHRKQVTFTALLARDLPAREKIEVVNQAQADHVVGILNGAVYTVGNIRQRESERRPAPPFTTSTLQQEAYRKLRFPAKRTMAIAQQLYEGIDIGAEGEIGLITYMRTDSPTVSEQAIQETRGFIKQKYGEKLVPEKPREYKARTKGAQEAHEAIRPTSTLREPASLRTHLSPEQFRLYDLIWKRMVASQMANAIFDSTTADVEGKKPGATAGYVFEAKGQVERFAGFLAVYSEGKDTVDDDDDSEALPPLTQGEVLEFLKLAPEQKFTQPPGRYTEATLVKALEENGIGRPSTYAPTISTIQDRLYVKKENGSLHPQQIGRMVMELLENNFKDIVDLGFTARMEEELDEIAEGGKAWEPVLTEFYAPFKKDLDEAQIKIVKQDEPTSEICDKCGRPMVIKSSRYGLFLSCSGYPECSNAKPLQEKVGVKCPKDQGELVKKRSKKGKTFYSCANYPNCDFITNLRPIPEPCPNCGGLLTAFPRGGVVCTKCEYKGKRPKAKQGDEGMPTVHAEPELEREPVGVGA